jgi:hypothetical protein
MEEKRNTNYMHTENSTEIASGTGKNENNLRRVLIHINLNRYEYP